MAGKWVIRVHVQRDTFFALTGSVSSPGLPKLANDRTTDSVRDEFA